MSLLTVTSISAPAFLRICFANTPWASVTPSSSRSTATLACAAGWPSMRALTSMSRRSPQAPSKTAASSTERKRRGVVAMAIPSVMASGLRDKADAGLHRGRLDIDLAGIDDFVLVGGRALDRFALGLLDLAQLELDFLAERADLYGLGLGLVADAARLHLVDAGLDGVLGRLEFALLVHRGRARSLLDRGLRIDHVDHRALRALVRDRLLAAVNEPHRSMNRAGTAGHQQQGDWDKQRSCGHDLSPVNRQRAHGTRHAARGCAAVLFGLKRRSGPTAREPVCSRSLFSRFGVRFDFQFVYPGSAQSSRRNWGTDAPPLGLLAPTQRRYASCFADWPQACRPRHTRSAARMSIEHSR